MKCRPFTVETALQAGESKDFFVRAESLHKKTLPTVGSGSKHPVLLPKLSFIWRSIKHFGRNVKLLHLRSQGSAELAPTACCPQRTWVSPLPDLILAPSRFRRNSLDYGCHESDGDTPSSYTVAGSDQSMEFAFRSQLSF
jgi:hypothetical protein